MRFKVLSLVAAALLLAACESSTDTRNTSTGTGAPTATTMPPAATSGIVPGSREDFVVNVGDRVFFGYDQFTLSADSQRLLDRQSAWLRRFPNVRLTIEGHADERGTREYNLALGERRANAVRDYLVATGIPSARLSTVSYGKERPAVLGSNESAWSQNRRGVSVVQ